MNNIQRIENPGFKQRLIIKSFKTSQSMHDFLNSQYDNKWSVTDKQLKAGTYAFCGGNWHNVKNLDSSVLAHV